MKEDIKTKWVEALRTGTLPDGTKVKQVKSLLRKTTPDNIAGCCCLGVLCEIALAEGVVTREPFSGGYLYRDACEAESNFDHSDSVLPRAVVTWAGLPDATVSSTFSYNGYKEVEVPNDGGPTLLTKLNDDDDYSFEQIADVIEEWL